ncbi:MAG: LLM class flavin-dependent oxidoreductase [Acidimicrobiia bacterium]|nr:LLM class flavin-dependent oxidoreductase [Acidimicrobiia bacterium]MYG58797.1 LLM class flavin-dependent oxidoreductase [Acidimicrobiia bacterium]MYJ33521.1 LLM class flavin-dependent oxidoreductase [Acidimicrobiia bacterium]
MQFGMIISDVPRDVDPIEQFDGILRQVEAGQRNGLSHFVIGQHFLYGDLRWLQPVPLLARLAAEIDDHVRLATTVLLAPKYHPVILAEELATLDIITQGRLDVGLGLGYRSEEFNQMNVPFNKRVSLFDECLDIMKLCWAMEDFDYLGQHWQIEGATPHIQCVQQPHPPIWIGAHSRKGARRAGAVGDRFIIPSEYDIHEMRVRLGIMATGFAERGKTMGHQPLRRNAFVGATSQEARAEFVDVSKERYLTYARKDLDVFDEEALMNDFFEEVKSSVAVGTAQEVIDHFTEVVRELPIDPIVVKPQWPQMHIDEVIDYLDTMGREVIPALAEVPPMPIEDIPASLASVADEVAEALEAM